MKTLLIGLLLSVPGALYGQTAAEVNNPEAGGIKSVIAVAIDPSPAWRTIYHEVEKCSGLRGNFDLIKWAVMEEPIHRPKGDTYAITAGNYITLVQDDTTYLRHEMLHHILEVNGWVPPPLAPGAVYDVADTHPTPPFFVCTGGR